MTAGNKITRKTTATTTINENMNNASFSAVHGITEVREAPNVKVTHERVVTRSLGNVTSHTKATAGNATLYMKDTVTRAAAKVVIDQQATNALNTNERNVEIYAQDNVDITRHAKHVNHVVDGQKKPAISVKPNRK